MRVSSTLLSLVFSGRIRAASVTVLSTLVSTPSAIPTSPSYTSDTSFESSMLEGHNFYRSEHNASALSWNTTSADYAANWASACNFEHSGGPTGENLAAGYANASAAVDGWGLEREKYNWAKPGFSEATGHFTQLVWSNTTSVGCGRAYCNGKGGSPGWLVVCEYWPEGNVVVKGEGDKEAEFEVNVKKQIECGR
ncbi:hypothetical protein B7494_g7732 [Chlorociboria aeruginascens]|nr:hypothetical protein B7494_g7732 [Chlorociboria aeruginascens]